MSASEQEPRIVTTEYEVARAIQDSLYLMGAIDESDIYEIVNPDGTTSLLQLSDGFKQFGDQIIQIAYPDCTVTLLSSGETT